MMSAKLWFSQYRLIVIKNLKVKRQSKFATCTEFPIVVISLLIGFMRMYHPFVDCGIPQLNLLQRHCHQRIVIDLFLHNINLQAIGCHNQLTIYVPLTFSFNYDCLTYTICNHHHINHVHQLHHINYSYLGYNLCSCYEGVLHTHFHLQVVLYAPNTTEINGLMDLFALLTTSSPRNDSTLKGFATNDEMQQWYMENSNSVWAGVS